METQQQKLDAERNRLQREYLKERGLPDPHGEIQRLRAEPPLTASGYTVLIVLGVLLPLFLVLYAPSIQAFCVAVIFIVGSVLVLAIDAENKRKK